MEIGNNKSFIVSAETEWVTADEGVQRQVLGYDEELMLVRVRFEKGAIGVLHRHFHRQVSYIESGSFEVSINDEKKVLHQGDSYFVEPNIEHGVLALEPGSIIDIFTPARKEFI